MRGFCGGEIKKLKVLEKRVDKRRDSGALRKDDQESEEQQHQNHWEHPPEFPLPEEVQQLAHDAEFCTHPLKIRHYASYFANGS